MNIEILKTEKEIDQLLTDNSVDLKLEGAVNILYSEISRQVIISAAEARSMKLKADSVGSGIGMLMRSLMGAPVEDLDKLDNNLDELLKLAYINLYCVGGRDVDFMSKISLKNNLIDTLPDRLCENYFGDYESRHTLFNKTVYEALENEFNSLSSSYINKYLIWEAYNFNKSYQANLDIKSDSQIKKPSSEDYEFRPYITNFVARKITGIGNSEDKSKAVEIFKFLEKEFKEIMSSMELSEDIQEYVEKEAYKS
jgi:hypothetical protein